MLRSEGTSREEIGREAFIERVWEWREEYGGGSSSSSSASGPPATTTTERFTLDDAYPAGVLKVFVDLYEKGLIYRDRYLVNWDPGLATAVSDLEVEEREVTRHAVSIAYPIQGAGRGRRRHRASGDDAGRHRGGGSSRTTSATAPHRPPATLPLVGRELPIIADDHVKRDFGTGVLKITPGHDPNDFEIGRNHGLEEVSVIGEDGA